MQNEPAVVVTFKLEASPRVHCDFANSSAEARMLVWLESRPELLALIQRALELASDTQAA
jgi:hypothetical protein